VRRTLPSDHPAWEHPAQSNPQSGGQAGAAGNGRQTSNGRPQTGSIGPEPADRDAGQTGGDIGRQAGHSGRQTSGSTDQARAAAKAEGDIRSAEPDLRPGRRIRAMVAGLQPERF
jgi:hypothetical protein